MQSDAAAQKGAVENARNQARSAIGLDANNQVSGGALGQFQNSLDARVAADNAQRQADYQRMQQELQNHQVSNADLQYLGGLGGNEQTYNLDTSKYLKPASQITVQNDASDADYAKYLALTKLAGIDPTYLTPQSRSEAGSAPAVSFDVNQFRADQAAAAKLDPTMQQYQNNVDYYRSQFPNDAAFQNWLTSNSPDKQELSSSIAEQMQALEDYKNQAGFNNRFNSGV